MLRKRDDVATGFIGELQAFHALADGLPVSELDRPTRCAGWTVADLIAHVTGVVADITAGRLDGAGTQAWYDRQVEERRGRSSTEVVDELRAVIPTMGEIARQVFLPSWDDPGPPGVPGTIGSITLSLWAGFYIHSEDVLAALGRAPRRGPGLTAAVAHICGAWDAEKWGSVTVALDGLEEIDVAGGGPRIKGDALAFVLATSGRADPTELGLDRSVNVYA